MKKSKTTILSKQLVFDALGDSFRKLNPVYLIKNPVIFITELGAIITTLQIFFSSKNGESYGFILQISLWLWFTVLFANFAEAIAEGRGKAQASALRNAKTNTTANKIGSNGKTQIVQSDSLAKGDVILINAGELIPADGEIIAGAATVDESAITGESAPVIREAGGDRSAVTGGTRVLSDWIKVTVSVNHGESFLDRMIGLVEGAKRRKTPNEIALSILLAGMTLIFMVVVMTMRPFGMYSNISFSITVLVSLLICLIPTTIGGLLSAIGIAGMDRLLQKNVLAMSGRAIEAAGDIDVLLLDKTGTITLGNRQAVDFFPASDISIQQLAESAMLASISDETPEGKSIVTLAMEQGIPAISLNNLSGAVAIPFSAQTRMSGLDWNNRCIRKGSGEAIMEYADSVLPPLISDQMEKVSKSGGTPLLVAESQHILGVIHLKDIVKSGLPDRFKRFRAMGIRTIMITGDNPLTAAAIAKEAGVDDFLAQAKPEDKLNLIRKEQARGHMVAMTGDGTNDAPALAQADVGVAMQSGTQAAKEAGNLVDLDSNPTKLIEIVEIGKQLLMTRGVLTTFSIANDVAKYFAILPALLIAAYPQIAPLNMMHLHSPSSAVLSAVIFNALVIIALIPLALRGVEFRPFSAEVILRRNLLIYGVGGIISPFIGIKIIDTILTATGLV